MRSRLIGLSCMELKWTLLTGELRGSNGQEQGGGGEWKGNRYGGMAIEGEARQTGGFIDGQCASERWKVKNGKWKLKSWLYAGRQ